MSKADGAVAVLVHGAWHGGWCWDPVVAELEERGHSVWTLDLPSRDNPAGDLHGDAQAVKELVESLGRPVVLMGHSYGGAVITEASAGTDAVKHLVYLTAVVPDVGESVLDAGTAAFAGTGGPPAEEQVATTDEMTADDAAGAVMDFHDDGTMSCRPERAVDLFYHDCDPSVAAEAVAALVPQPLLTFSQASAGAGWKEHPSTYVVCTDDHILSVGGQRNFARHCDDVVVLTTSHSPFFSDPGGVADIVERLIEN
jgi:pimeloyl-ACP methyl ester carboxylesterase